jgi:hypothetical protein
MRVFTTTPMFLLLALAMSSAYGQNAPAAATPAATKPADAKTDPKADTSKVDAKSAAAAKPAAAAAATTDAKKPADASAKPATPAVADTKPDAKKPAAPAAAASPAAATAAGAADDGAAAKPVKADGPPCVVAEFRAIGIDEQDVTKRRSRALSWLQQRSKQCSVEQLLMIRNNRSQWMGTADSAKLASVVDSLLEAIAAENPRVAALLYGTPPPPPPPGGEDKK